ncbi:exodeoxyribonuclease V subunit beta [Alkalimonas sp. MEB108]|uniref:RecBCD enzyme subunit RecB n=1 Tax=Alkalimonas cellulosilytica TaxID=3058395 RepID=A0ABU7J9E2_9GAMM|nr:exodeoxyribonuclease V subunit beta [Alkalimonas sp. MEB108]MEE2003161.1 exodeoxyribonuclease V subunit beta [Alkalimonas sp. MEB108]
MSSEAIDLTNPLDFPLHGSRLIEASAGTGKTYTIAALYVRLVLQHGRQGLCFARELLPKDILVMTFTRAATAELSDRIRTRLSDAADYFRADNASKDDEFLQNLKAYYLQAGSSEADLSRLARRLELAAESMDESAVHTINGWCQKMLTEHAFASGSLFEQEVKTEEDELKLAAAEDYFRRFVYNLKPELAQEVIDLFSSPEQLVKKIGRAAEGELLATQDYPPLAAVHEEVRFKAESEVQLLKDKYRKASNVLAMVLDLTNLHNETRKSAAQALSLWLNTSAIEIVFDKSEQKKELTYDKLFGKFGADLPAVAEVFKDLLDDVEKTKAIAKQADSTLLQHASGYIYARFQELKQQAAIMGFDDMLTRLRDALRGPNGQLLAQCIREQYPVALVDEFQDTDPVQYEIFDTIYRVERNDAETGIFLIGDPKQAIYSFRNADIFTYLKARHATEGRHYNLKKNFRSTKAMVDAVNALFYRADENTDRGAFLYKQEIPFVSVDVNGQSKVFKGLDGTETAALHWHVVPEPAAKKDAYQKPAARYHANLIAQLLNSDKAGFYEGDARTAVAPKDIAVLVANAKEARLIRAELSKRGIRSVYLSESDSVYAQPVASDLLALVQACAQPLDTRRVRRALAVPLLAEPLSRLIDYQENELAWEAAVERFMDYHELWLRFGVLAALQRLLHDFQVPARLLADAGEGERQLADTLHICELLQQASVTLEGMASLEEHFALQVQEYKVAVSFEGSSKRTNSEALQLRLESDAELVKVITYHKSKGLQYPLVFMPFPAYTMKEGDRFKDYRFPQSYHALGPQGERVKKIAWSKGDKEAKSYILEEALAEDVRKMYVALTRAEFATFVTLQVVGEPKHNPLFHLLYGDETNTEKLTDVLEKARERWQSPGVLHTEVAVMQETEQVSLQGRDEPVQSLTALIFAGDFKSRSWWVSSYSALSYGTEMQTPETPLEMNMLEGKRDDAVPAVVVDEHAAMARIEYKADKAPGTASGEGRIHHLPKGAGPGTFLHTLLEDAAELGFDEVAKNSEVRSSMLDKACKNPYWQEHRAALDSWLQQYLQVRFELPGEGGAANHSVALADLTTYKAEPEFWFETRQVSTTRLDALIARHIHPAFPRPKLDATRLNGMLKGFIDLVFEYHGKYYVADYKSNWLGEHDADYNLDAMRSKILASRYDLQYVLYILALHKLLKARLGEAYCYDRHVGGAVYLFLRGHHADSRGAFFDRPPRQLIEALESEFLAQGEAHV